MRSYGSVDDVFSFGLNVRSLWKMTDAGRTRHEPVPSTPEEVFRQESASLSPPATFLAVPDCNCVIAR
jgi:hypothetical protein